MARRLVRRRNLRANPTRATGMILVNPFRSNPKKRKNKSKAKAARAKRVHATTGVRRRKSKYGAGGRWASKKYASLHNRRRSRRRSNGSVRRRRNYVRRFYNRRRSRRNALVVRGLSNRRRNRRHNRKRNGSHRRRNPNGVGGMLSKIPVIGPTLAAMVSFAVPAVFGAVSVEPVMWVAKALAPFVPQVPASLFYPVVGVLVASLIRFVPGLSTETKKSLALAVASAAGGVGYYKARTGADAEMATEAGLLELRGVGGLGSILQIRENRQLSGYGYAYNPHYVTYAGAGYGDGGAYQVVPGAPTGF